MNVTCYLTKASTKFAKRQMAESPLKVNAADVQGLVFRGYGSLRHCSYLLLGLADAPKGCAWLRGIRGQVATGESAPRQSAIHVAFTHPGLRALGLPDATLSEFSRAFMLGMTDADTSRFLGDAGESAPERWDWGGEKTPPVHALLALYADTAAHLTTLEAEHGAELRAQGINLIRTLRTTDLDGVEHFGFSDGISQPAIEGYHSATSKLHNVKPGEFILGYANEYGLCTERPLLAARNDPFARLPLDVEGSPRHDLGRNGSYVVFRQLRQNVSLFRKTLDTLSRRPDGSADETARGRLAAQMVGRWPNGAPLVLWPDHDDPSKVASNEFSYHALDPDGTRCPIGAHVRRANPRDSLDPNPGTEDSLAVNRRHRLLRRGRSYGPRLEQGVTDAVDRGLYFIALNANIARQFEFIQHSWVNDPRFNGLFQQADPLVGALHDNQFTIDTDTSPKRCVRLPRFVTVAGGAYFFMPGLRALRFLSELS